MTRDFRGTRIKHLPGGAIEKITRLGPKHQPRRAKRGGGGCFTATTLVQTITGHRPISDIRPGDIILSFDEAHSCLLPRRVTQWIEHQEQEIWEIRTTHQQKTLSTTASHSFLSKCGWKTTKNLRVGDVLYYLQSGKSCQTVIVDIQLTTRVESVYNLYTSTEHNFIVEGLIAHNFSFCRVIRTLWHNLYFDRSPKIVQAIA